MRIKSILSIVFLASIAAFATGCQPVPTPTTQPAAPVTITPAKQLTIELALGTLGINGLANARDTGLITQAELNLNKPYIDAFRAAKNAAEADINAGNTSNFTDDLNQLNAAYLQLIPLLQKSATVTK